MNLQLWQIILLSAVTLMSCLIGVLYLAPQLYRWIQVSRWRRLKGMVALTYDDGPDSMTSIELLNLLDELDVKATFYLVGFRAEKEPAVVDLLKRSQHELGTHSFSHWHAWKTLPWTECIDAERAYQTLDHALSANAPYRPPFGKISLLTLIWMLAHGRRVDWWNQPTKDTDEILESPTDVATRVLADGEPVILMHSHHAEPHRRKYVLELTKALISQARQKGLRFVTMSEISLASSSHLSSST